MIVLVLLVLAGFALYVMNPDERARLLRTTLVAVGRVRTTAMDRRPENDVFHDALCARTPWVVVTPALVTINVAIFAGMLFGRGALSDPQTLVAWGASWGPRTTNAEWWRFATALFVHSGMLHLLINVAGLVQVGLVLERLVGPVALATVYMASGILAGVVSLSADPIAVTAGASAAIFGVYGLLLASLIWDLARRASMTIPVSVLRALAPAAGVFILFNVAIGEHTGGANFAGFVAGFSAGLLLVKGVSDCKPPVRRVAVALAATLAIAVASTVPLRGLSDARPEIERVIALEDRTAHEYETAVVQFRLGAMTAEALAQLIDRKITPELREARTRLEALDGIPRDQQSMVADADQYLRLRDESWQLRADALHKANMLALRKADKSERASLDLLERLRSADPN